MRTTGADARRALIVGPLALAAPGLLSLRATGAPPARVLERYREVQAR
jgi:hypothetical protein